MKDKDIFHATHEHVTHKQLNAAAFGVALFSSVLLSLQASRNPAKRWRQLRVCALQLTSQIWQYRTRVGSYATSSSSPHQPEVGLGQARGNWHQQLLGDG